MLDESIAHSKPSDWGRVILLEQKLVDLIGSSKFEHILPNPIEGLLKISRELKGQDFSTIIDLTGWLTPSLRDLFPFTPIINNFSLSRVRVTSSPNLETSGYTVSMNQDEIDETKKGLNFDRTLVIDDTTFTGWTSLKTMELWKLRPESTTHAFLIANTGMLSPEKGIKGAVGELEGRGCQVIFGHELATPRDDGWHLKDLHQHPRIAEAFNLGVDILKLIDGQGADSEIVRFTLNQKEVMDVLFPERLTTDEIANLLNEGKFISSGKVDFATPGLIHTKNPLLWASRYFREHIDLQKVDENRGEILGILTELHGLTEDKEASRESSHELKRIMLRENGYSHYHGKER